MARDWCDLQQRLDHSRISDGLFVSWHWLDSWLQMLADQFPLYVFEYRDGDEIAALGVFSLSTVKRRKLVSSRVLSLQTVPGGGFNIASEYNGLLAAEAHLQTAWQALLQALLAMREPRWDELYLDGLTVADQTVLNTLPQPLKRIEREQFSPWKAELASPDLTLDDLLSGLSRNRRWQIRRSFKAYAEQAEPTIDIAQSPQQALDYFAAMEQPHTQHWNRLGKPGSFANPNWVAFHRQLISNSFADGCIQLAKVSAGEEPIGYLYNLVWGETVYVLQSGFYYDTGNNKKRPGYVSHCLAMLASAQQGYRYYDFMIGESEYKQVLAEQQPALAWLSLQRPRWQLLLENLALKILRAVRRWRAAAK